eukprot:CAMPEP_0194363846 /NCGR_PEP_ID=MMETSP0174-20130528/11710_1 /TAXON_ID=216777 /ORGANISM="Proboscia alata, Strain PI-D3" /LENGTH=154 /DNA_ID=CAMNT_0039137541 /DNA_START=51 /DNA_END=515 /DNA_ORIENTATION=-
MSEQLSKNQDNASPKDGKKRSQNALRDLSGEVMRLLMDTKGNRVKTAKEISEKITGSKEKSSCDRRIHDVFNVMHAMGMIHKNKGGGIYWIGNTRAKIDQHDRSLEQQAQQESPHRFYGDAKVMELINEKENLLKDIKRKKKHLVKIFRQAGVL